VIGYLIAFMLGGALGVLVMCLVAINSDDRGDE